MLAEQLIIENAHSLGMGHRLIKSCQSQIGEKKKRKDEKETALNQPLKKLHLTDTDQGHVHYVFTSGCQPLRGNNERAGAVVKGSGSQRFVDEALPC